MQKSFDLSLLSKYRMQLMGIAMLWIMLGHSRIDTSSLPLLGFIKNTAYGGVDLFLILSGFGLFFSLNKDFSIKSFYKRRLLRILPYYLPLVLVYSIYLVLHFDFPPSLIFYNLTTLSFWLNVMNQLGIYGFDWYIPSLLMLYLVTPFYMKVFKKNPVLSTILVSVTGILISLLISDTKFSYLLIFTIRIPIYFAGILLGYYVSKKSKINIKGILLQLFFLIIGLLSLYYVFYVFKGNGWSYGLFWYPTILIAFPLLILFSTLLSLFKDYKFPILSFFGTYSLVIYLFHERLLTVFHEMSITGSPLVLNSIVIALTLILGYLYQNLVSNILDKKTDK